MTTAADLVRALLFSSQKAADVARLVRTKHELFSLLVQEKGSREKNARFVHDFKTLADVLIQETIRNDLTKKFADFTSNDIHGEESNKFTNALGESVVVEVKATPAETAATLARVLDNNKVAAELLAGVVHGGDEEYEAVLTEHRESLASLDGMNLPISQLAIWIDPIDSTAEYINGKDEDGEEGVICADGLLCVTILIGVYDKDTGAPVMGIINQPFHRIDKETRRWMGRHFWGVTYNGQSYGSLLGSNGSPYITQKDGVPAKRSARVLLSGSEDPAIREALERAGHLVTAASGAGYKLLCVALGEADAYLLTRPTTFFWDSCAPHALLRAIGGGIIDFSRTAVEAGKLLAGSDGNVTEFGKKVAGLQLRYHHDTNNEAAGSGNWCNLGGVVAYRDELVLREILRVATSKAK